ncbi:hypothetical protein EVAR_254_1 [Eumeta japonica]|uniref:HAT C-terminal dimerisation domain-containing protein n=1 Tax=Eumeta variegata TaxID=151549 RepID=A0A4C1S944_EUMVA|nr:hypothetical protein EVAR_254_1 [Eumeta japonica]
MLDLEFRIAMVVAKKILSTLQPADAALQARSAGLKDAITIIKCVKDEIIKLRSNQMYNQILEEAKSLTSNDCGESENRTQTSKRQVKKPNRMDDYLTYTPCSSARQNIDENDEPFKSEYFETLDILIAELQRRFSDNDDLINSIASLKIPSREEASVVKAYLSRNEDIMENTLQVLYRQREAFKDTYELFASVATIGCSTAVCESTFSTLTAINRPQRLSMGHERMAGMLPNDMANYMEYHVMGSVSQIRMKPGCVPSKFECQPDRRKRTSDSNERKYIAKKQRREVEQKLQNKTTTTVATKQLELEDPSPGTSAMQESTTKDAPKMVNKSIQVYITNKFRSKAVQTEINSVDQMTSPLKPFCRSAFTSPFKIKSTKPSISTIQKCTKKLIGFQDDSDSDISYTPSVAHSESPSVTSLKIKSSSDCSELIEDDKKQEASRILAYTLQKIKKNPRIDKHQDPGQSEKIIFHLDLAGLNPVTLCSSVA